MSLTAVHTAHSARYVQPILAITFNACVQGKVEFFQVFFFLLFCDLKTVVVVVVARESSPLSLAVVSGSKKTLISSLIPNIYNKVGEIIN